MLDTLAIVKTPTAARRIFSAALWRVRTKEKILYLTFDDGPMNEVTPQVLDLLQQYKAKATFFCIGKNINDNPDLYQRIIAEGHTVGNHTHDHYNGWQTDNSLYYESVTKCAHEMRYMRADISLATDSVIASGVQPVRIKSLFRPPYGKLTLTQYRYLKGKYKIVMWDVLAFDFDLKVTKEQVLENVINNTAEGSIIVFHDSLKAKEKVLYALPLVLAHYSDLGYRFESLRGR